MLVLVETPAGYGLFKVQNAKFLQMDADTLAKELSSTAKLQKNILFQAFSKFKETKVAIEETTALIDSTMGKGLKKFLKKNIVKAGLVDQLAVCDKALVSDIRKHLGIEVVYSANTNEIIRGIRGQIHELVAGLTEKGRIFYILEVGNGRGLGVVGANLEFVKFCFPHRYTKTMALSLSHSLSRFKLKFSPDKIDTMIVQAIGLLDDLDRELNNFAMRLKEWYGWHFPELHKIISDNQVYAVTVKKIGIRKNTRNVDLSFLPEDIAAEIKQSAEISMGTEITDDDLANILELADRVEELTEYRNSLAEYLKHRMNALAPNLTHMVGELVGARLISHSGSLMNLAKHPSSTVQILGAEKALFRALKTKSQTPKYGLIYHATLVGQTAPKFKGKISRVLAAKLSLCIRVDALGDQEEPTVAIENRKYVERKLEELSEVASKKLSRPTTKPSFQKYQPNRSTVKSQSSNYDASADIVIENALPDVSNKRSVEQVSTSAENEMQPPAKKKKKEKAKTKTTV
ncbi:putative nucleolar protein 5 [Cardiosporidium cionae]|uniref:Nucleolar protein 5 n=1 Tax=Cardiosporidium cionae TaxID=476202 RepID=A0ABQ7JCF0_9APIC|nr:putative nucleolar protein 5 [Cardiosporidium cionae]|eukprot:KAF8821656.1 putative nucleolar protein 5 [Cardiosporidium cionae]